MFLIRHNWILAFGRNPGLRDLFENNGHLASYCDNIVMNLHSQGPVWN